MKMKHIANMKGAQDGAIFGGYLFRFDAKGQGCVYDLKQMSGDEVSELSSMCDITLDRAEEIVPHSNAVFFGKEYYAEGDDFPLLYSKFCFFFCLIFVWLFVFQIIYKYSIFHTAIT